MEWEDEIVDEVRHVRDAYAAKFDYDISRICEDLRRRQREREKREEVVTRTLPANEDPSDVRNAA